MNIRLMVFSVALFYSVYIFNLMRSPVVNTSRDSTYIALWCLFVSGMLTMSFAVLPIAWWQWGMLSVICFKTCGIVVWGEPLRKGLKGSADQ